MHTATIYMNPVEPAAIGFATAAGLPGDVRFTFKSQAGMPYPGVADLNPQLVMRPFTTYGAFGYDIVIDDPDGASGLASIPAPVLNDRFNVEVYTRNIDLQPLDLIAVGRIDLKGYGYGLAGPLGPMSYPVGPSGPAGERGPTGAEGPIGPEGMRGSRWYTGVGDPTLPDYDRVMGDMYLDESNGAVWRWDGVSWSAFHGR